MSRRIFYHIAFWAGYVFFKAYINFESGANQKEGQSVPDFFLMCMEVQSVFLLVKVPLAYSLFYVADKYLSKEWTIFKTFASGILLFAAAIIGFIYINHYLVLQLIYKIPSDISLYFKPGSILYTFFILCFACGIALTIKLVRANIRQKENEKTIIKQKLETELRFLKSQTNPHFLFNTLNNIYALARKKSDDTADAVMKLSKLLRFMLYESGKPMIPVSDELKLIENYIELEKIRYSDRLKITYSSSIDDPSQPVAPLILLPFVENAFKHGASETRFNSFIDIDIKLQAGQLELAIENSKAEDPEKMNSEKIGLGNVSRQLELMYPTHKLEIDNQPDSFKVSLKINLLKHATL
jgi:two-component system, LytTR family, sensor kinase